MKKNKKILLTVLLCFSTHLRASRATKEINDSSPSLDFSMVAFNALPFYTFEQKTEVQIELDRKEFFLKVEELCQTPVGWLSKKQLDELRTAHHDNPELNCFKCIDLLPVTVVDMHFTVLTFPELLVYEQMNQATVDIVNEEAVVISKP